MNLTALKESAENLDSLLRKYSDEHEDARSAMKQCSPIIEGILAGRIQSPRQVPFPGYYFGTESTLFEHRDVCQAAAMLSMYLQGWNSEEEFNVHMENIMTKANSEHELLSPTQHSSGTPQKRGAP